jgi:hypothetical protein
MKKNIIYLLCVITLLTSCSSAYRTSQTPDDVYYSPSQKIYSDDHYQSYTSSSDDEYLRMKVQDHYRWGSLDDYDYWNDSRYYYNNYYNPWNSYYSLSIWYNPYSSYWYNPWNSWYSPYCTVVYYKNPRVYYGGYNRYHLSTYNNRTYNTNNLPLQNGNRNAYNNSNSNVNRTRNFNINQNQNNNSRPIRTFNNSNSSVNTSSGSRSSGGNSGGGSRSRPPR